MRVGIDIRLWNQTGVGRYIRNLVTELLKIDKKNEYVFFVRSKDLEDIQRQISGGNFKIVKADIKWHSLSEQIQFPKLLNKENLDLVHFPYFSVPVFYKQPFVVTIHDLIVHHFPTGKASTLALPLYLAKLYGYKYVIRTAAKNAKKIIAVSNATKEEVVDHLGVDGDKVAVVHNGIDQNFFKNLKTKAIIDFPYFLYVGNAYPHKNLENLLSSFAEVSEFNDKVKLVMVGKNDYFYNRLKKRAAKLNIEKSLIFYENTSDELLTNLYRNALALVSPSLMEGFGLPLVEAMYNKCLVICSDIASFKEICQDNALYFDLKDRQGLYKKLEQVLKNPEVKEKYIQKGFDRSLSFSFEKAARQTLAIYESCLSV
jgi:glycosyltransferase involved in cell wall biosynthesis